jgi:hypothetical protein
VQRLLDAYHAAGEHGLTDHEAAAATGLPLQSICSLRWCAIDGGLVRKGAIRIGQFGAPNQAWVTVTT